MASILSFTEPAENADLYDPDFEVPHKRKGKPPQYRNIGTCILKGRFFVNKTNKQYT